jgi:GDPmannose 4,6-dehydratase
LYNKFNNNRLFPHYGDLSDTGSLYDLIKKIKPHEIYNLAAQSHVMVSFLNPEYTSNINALGALRILECIRQLNLIKKVKFYQASSSELFGLIQDRKQSEKTPFYPQSPYAVSKLFAYWITKNYREAYGMFACNGILFNHESKRRGETFVTRKITMGLCNISFGLEKCLYLGNLDSLRDWGHAMDYAEMQWMMMQKKEPKDYVISTGVQCSVKKFFQLACNVLKIKITWKGQGVNQHAIVSDYDSKITPNIKRNQIIARVDKKYFRPAEVDSLLGDCRKAKKELKWRPHYDIYSLAKEMVSEEIKKINAA